MSEFDKKLLNKRLRKHRVRAKVLGSASRPRLSVAISNTSVSAQLVDDETGRTILSSTTVNLKEKGSLTKQAVFVGSDIAKKAKKAKINAVVFDRNGRKYAKRLNALAEAARKEGLEF